MFFNVVDAYTYKNYTVAITWPFIHLINVFQCLRRTNKIFFSLIKMPLVTSVHTKVTSNCLMVFVVRYTHIATELS